MPRDHNPANSTRDAAEGPLDDAGSAPRPGRAARAPFRSRWSTTRRAQRLGGVLSAVALLAAGGGLVSAAALSPQGPGSSRALAAPLAAVPAGSSVGICPGPARLLDGAAAGTDPQFSAESASARTSVDALVLASAAGTVPGSRLASLSGSTVVELAKAATASGTPMPAAPTPASAVQLAGVLPQRSVDAASVLSADAQGGRQPSAGAVLRYTAEDGDLRGAAAAACQQPANDLWLVGAATALGRTAVLSLSNASSSPATVSLDLFGAKGTIQAPGSRGLLVAPGTTRSIILAGLAPGEERLSVRVRSAGGPVAALIQQSVLRGLTAGGVEFITPAAAPALRQVVPGVDIQDGAGVAALTGTSGFADAGPALQITVPGSADAVVAIKLFGRDGQKVLPAGGVVTAKAGSVTQVPLTGVPAGPYTVAISSDVSFTAAARATRGLKAEDPTDFAWSTAAARLGSDHVVPVPGGGDRFLVFGAPEGRATISYAPVTADGKIRTAASADIAGGTTASVKVPAEVEGSRLVGYVVSAAGDPAYGAVLLQQDGRQDISTIAIAPGAAGQEQVPVTLGY
ncbi:MULTISPECIES: DUF5719 family protein [unclassified Arthrobacter]|uniref:DUF5719 family protein n=1 Tax=unclassified Arthrobacter TaxID=235627 RepID=UPI002E08627D|nr:MULTISPECIES: DUF5719 family protein [unclassified Arthrobacter]MEC5190348.1 hypothetical protein [Arthrobacter sp. MP_M4]MEC5202721.1 hypothetical protein [Arthrobacter sp. MP_M7]